MSKIQPPSPVYLGPAKFHGGVQSAPFKRIVVHCTVSPCEPGGARNVARYFRETVTRPSSAHYIVDPFETVQVVGDHTVAFHAPPNGGPGDGTIGVELCDPQAGPTSRWFDDDHQRMLRRGARLVARLCLAYDVPVQKITVRNLVDGVRGVCGHHDVSLAFRQTSHTDPGEGFPWGLFMGLVRDYAKRIEARAEGADRVVEFTVVQANLGRGVGKAEFVANVRRLPRDAVKHINEADGADRVNEHEVLARELPPGWAAFDTQVPINIPAPWRTVRTRVTIACKGLEKLTPHRPIVQAVAELDDETPPIVFVNTHFPRRHPLLVTRRRQCRRVLREVVALWHERGFTVVWAGDTNTLKMPLVHPLEQRVVSDRLDHLGVVVHPDGAQLEVVASGVIDLTIDGHNAPWARLRVTRKANR